ncbi:MAG: glycosyltransferase [Hyphomicrobiaceae bacterium]
MTADLVVFGEDWGAHPSSTQHLVRRLAADRKVVWINSIGMRRPRMDGRDLRRALGKAGAMISGRRNDARPERVAATSMTLAASPVPNNLSVHSVAAIPAPASRAAFALNRTLLGRQVRRLMHDRDIVRPVLWTSLPTALPAVGEFGERAVVYYCGDDFGALAGVDHGPVLEMEERLVARADLVLAASEVLARRFPARKTRLVPHGADIALFSTPAPRAPELPAGVPIAGFYGALADWIDVDLIAAVARSLPRWRFVFVGPVATDVTLLATLDNVTMLGARPHASLPGFAQHWDVSLIPFRDCPQIHAANPLKLREYLAAGAPIASTPFPALRPYRDLVQIGAGEVEFRAAILAAAADKAGAEARRGRVAAESWDGRAAEVSAALDAL